MNQIKICEFFAGSRSIGKVADKKNMQVFSIDWKPFNNIDLIADIENLEIKDIPFIPDLIWGSPDCTTYSISAISKHRNGINPKSDYAKKSDKVIINFLKIINEFILINPRLLFFIENPRGMLRKMPFMQKLKRHTIWYCKYGDERAKPTDIWTNSELWHPRDICHNGNKLCHHQKSPRGSKTGTQGKLNAYERSKLPVELCNEILDTAIKELA